MMEGNRSSGRRGSYASTRVGGTFWRTNSDGSPNGSPRAREHGHSVGGGWSSRAAAWQNYAVFFVCGMCLTYPWNAINAAVAAISDELGREATDALRTPRRNG